jgi:5-methylcytosine-specific restriction endonuclease McrA
LTKMGNLTRVSPLDNTPEREAQRQRDKANVRSSRAKRARFYDELTELVCSEAHKLRLLRKECTGIEWHVDHIIPLKGEMVSGLHIYSNLRVIPKIENLRKGNSCPI